jgi:hypothetical protein
VDDLISSPSGTLWKEPTLHKKLKAKMDGKYTPFERTMTEMSLLLEELSRKLGWDRVIQRWVKTNGMLVQNA